MSAETFFRFHAEGIPTFRAEHAYSGLWGGEWLADGSASQCRECDGIGTAYGETCRSCNGEGWDPAQEGYSCCDTAQDLIAYFAQHLGSDPGPGMVIEFEGQRVGNGFDGEPLAIPTSIIRTMTWKELTGE